MKTLIDGVELASLRVHRPPVPSQRSSSSRSSMADAEAKKAPALADITVQILKTDMNEDMVADIETTTKELWGKHKLHKDLASSIKAAFDLKHPPADNKATSGVWHCIVGSDFACSVTHETHFACYWQVRRVLRASQRRRPPPACPLHVRTWPFRSMHPRHAMRPAAARRSTT